MLSFLWNAGIGWTIPKPDFLEHHRPQLGKTWSSGEPIPGGASRPEEHVGPSSKKVPTHPRATSIALQASLSSGS
ncbi:hypothetical protein CHARACLAT_000533 [Characodon lateralis]|uniref:Uncharacterized protein n=1 Tax=Characodon lateralis TaxID=208331 RepID=A0ABU7DZP5_9TELE|nr:hypothetical protein [Characodon lateralis]